MTGRETGGDDGFSPGPETQRAYRDALGRYATGVTVITASSETGPLGITANSFASVSLDPPLVLWSPAKASARYATFAATPRFAVHVLGAEQIELANVFARDGAGFDACDWRFDADGVPLIAGCLARFDCAKVADMDGGDHLIVLARVLRATMRQGEPLLFAAGSYGRFTNAA